MLRASANAAGAGLRHSYIGMDAVAVTQGSLDVQTLRSTPTERARS
jgi:hypothetical protein